MHIIIVPEATYYGTVRIVRMGQETEHRSSMYELLEQVKRPSGVNRGIWSSPFKADGFSTWVCYFQLVPLRKLPRIGSGNLSRCLDMSPWYVIA